MWSNRPPSTRLSTLPLLAVLAAPGGAQRAPDLEDPVRLRAGGEVIDTGAHIGHAGPLFADHDGDGLRDLLVGNFGGHVQVYRNVGSAEEPELRAQGLLQAEGKEIRIHNW